MIKKQGNFIEAHIEKVALLIGVLGGAVHCVCVCSEQRGKGSFQRPEF